MRLAVISDIHGNLPALEAVLADIRTRGVDGTVNLGDCVTSPLWPRETFELLESLALPTVRGNHDRGLAEFTYEQHGTTSRYAHDALTPVQRAALGRLPERLDLGDGILAVHGSPGNDTCYLLEEVVDGRLGPARREVIAERLGPEVRNAVVLCGHSHQQQTRLGPGGCLLLNPGSVGCPVFADAPHAPTLEYRSPHARYSILTRRNGRWGAEMLALEYDWHHAAARANANGRPEWAEAYIKGSVG